MKPSLKRKFNKAIQATKDFASGKTAAKPYPHFGVRNMCVFCGRGYRYKRPHKQCLDKYLNS